MQHDLPGLDLSLFALDGERQMATDESIVFHNNPALPGSGVTGRFSQYEAQFSIDLAWLGNVERLMSTASHDEWPLKRAGRLRAEVAGLAFEPLSALQSEKAAMLLEFYRYRGEWRVAAVGQGFAGGLAELIALFGSEVAQPPHLRPHLPLPVPSPYPPPQRPPVSVLPTSVWSKWSASTSH
ncbi:TerD family protein [Deinococcus rubellus]|uniref:TerD family protein n=1 Tax=Deinococcus rubellus TaxID=1889240 RepID=A0ABY5YJY0_9DEIO|nr:TerD family protein [Deinococcus rubellus]UWX65113.1 TerD family protein [Deinococcus rubellus]